MLYEFKEHLLKITLTGILNAEPEAEYCYQINLTRQNICFTIFINNLDTQPFFNTIFN